MNRLTLFAGGLAAALALLLGGCGSSGPNLNGPFGDSAKGPIGAQCFQSEPKGSVATLGMLSFSNKGGPARIDKVTLVDARDLQTVAEWVVPITGHDLMGVLDGSPPYGSKRGSQGLAPGIHWASRQRAVGATIANMPFPLSINLILVLRPTGSLGTVKTVYLDYESGGTKYRLNFQVAIELYNGSHKPCRLAAMTCSPVRGSRVTSARGAAVASFAARSEPNAARASFRVLDDQFQGLPAEGVGWAAAEATARRSGGGLPALVVEVAAGGQASGSTSGCVNRTGLPSDRA